MAGGMLARQTPRRATVDVRSRAAQSAAFHDLATFRGWARASLQHPVESPFDAAPSLLLSSPYHPTVHLAAFGAGCAARPTAKTEAAG